MAAAHATASFDASAWTAELRQLEWTLPDATRFVEAFLDGPRDEPALCALTVAFVRALLLRAPANDVTTHGHGVLESRWGSELESLRAYVGQSTGDAAEWTMLGLRALERLATQASTSSVRSPPIPTATELHARGVDLPGSPFRSFALMMAVFAALRRRESVEAITELIYRAFDDMSAFLAQAGAAGIVLDLYEGESQAQRAARTLRYVENFRSTLSEAAEDWLDGARMHPVR